MTTSYLIKEISKVDAGHFRVLWTDGLNQVISLKALQKSCPCAGCAANPPLMPNEVKALRLKNVGRYALRVDFASGCSYGIYTFDHLRNLYGQ